MAHSQRRVLVHQAGVPPGSALRQDLVEHHRVHAPEHEVAVGMHVVFVGDGDYPVTGLRLDEQVVRQRRAKRGDALASQIGQRAEAARIGRAHGQHLAELVVGYRDREARAPGRAVLDPAQGDVEIPARDRRVDTREPGLDESRSAAEAGGEQLRDLHVEADDARGIGRVGLDVRRAALGVTAPAQLGLRRGVCPRWPPRGRGCDQRQAHERAGDPPEAGGAGQRRGSIRPWISAWAHARGLNLRLPDRPAPAMGADRGR